MLSRFQDYETRLDEYIHRPDDTFSWYIHDEIQYNNVRVLLVNMTSQRWLNGNLVYCNSLKKRTVTRFCNYHQIPW